MSSPSRATGPSAHQKRTRIDVRTPPASTRTETGAIPDCYSCRGTGRVVGFGRHHGTSCPCLDAPEER